MSITPAQQVGGLSWKVAEGPLHPLPKVRFLPGPEAPRVLAFGRREGAPEVCGGLTQAVATPQSTGQAHFPGGLGL